MIERADGLRVDDSYYYITIPLHLEYKWAQGHYFETFLKGLKQGKILINQCPSCGRHQIPPINVCGRCHVEMGEWKEVGPRGTVFAFNIVVDPVYDSGIPGMREVPYTVAHIILDGAPDVTIYHELEEQDLSKLKVGMRVEAVFKPEKEREGLLSDIIYFRTVTEPE
ncbi:MAG TPA: Zn-ribbon domain-containing OB-fold protein [Dehalococcoidia bacterium]|nr:Zn-ribbon domain-containing OB-fold protein [Dehalococcoidia bacterium]